MYKLDGEILFRQRKTSLSKPLYH